MSVVLATDLPDATGLSAWQSDAVSDESYSGEELNTDSGSYSLDERAHDEAGDDQLQPEDTLVDAGGEGGDVLDAGFSPADRPRGSVAWGTTAWEQSQDETIEQRIRQEEPEEGTAYGAPDNESGLDEPEMLGGDDPDAIPLEDDFVSDSGQRAGRLVAPDQGFGEDEEKDEVAQDIGIDGAGASAEEAAMHIASDEAVGDFGTDDDADDLPGGLSEAAADAIRDEDDLNELDSLRGSDE